MRDRYIKALFIVLAAAGVEVQITQSVLAASVGEQAIKEVLTLSEIKTIRTDILLAVNALKNLNADNENEPAFHFNYFVALNGNIIQCEKISIQSTVINSKPSRFSNAACGKNILIRAPTISVCS